MSNEGTGSSPLTVKKVVVVDHVLSDDRLTQICRTRQQHSVQIYVGPDGPPASHFPHGYRTAVRTVVVKHVWKAMIPTVHDPTT